MKKFNFCNFFVFVLYKDQCSIVLCGWEEAGCGFQLITSSHRASRHWSTVNSRSSIEESYCNGGGASTSEASYLKSKVRVRIRVKVRVKATVRVKFRVKFRVKIRVRIVLPYPTFFQNPATGPPCNPHTECLLTYI